MKSRRFHKLIGLVMLLPFAAWSATAVFFLLSPGYEQAYARLEVRQYPLEEPLQLRPDSAWQELRLFRSVLGEHLLVKREGRWQQIDPSSGAPLPPPSEAELRRLATDAISVDEARYGAVETLEGNRLFTSTGVEIELDWNTLAFSQRGRDTRFIDQLYDIHYLQWTGIASLDRVLGLAGLFLLMFMTWTGAKLALRPGRRAPARPFRAALAPEV